MRVRPHIAVPVLLIAVALTGLGAWISHRAPVRVDDSVREEIAYGGEVLAVAEELTNASSPLFEYEYIAMDRKQVDVGAAIDQQVEKMRSSGWSGEPIGQGEGYHLVSDRRQTIAMVEPLEPFLRQWGTGPSIFPEQRAALLIAEKVDDPSKLVLVTLRHVG
ncbi:hypothetical protein Aple_014950 [Acrocarpospora pleiomorpha]|uniref:Uncharacterized protein n=1 Tax=Acrocarpospora pleiomorpha TaxID=90975 RepID=A0A5M3XBU6_9ACTN|nr:hypothetical protein [Acrocarpospora pleiomorpha]GES18600.1 hypothetical protein Aple_014950 [Acrocarpospora pleiomorpha]